MQRTLKGEFKVLEIVQRETIAAAILSRSAPKLNLGGVVGSSPPRTDGAQMNFLGSTDQHRFHAGKEPGRENRERGSNPPSTVATEGPLRH